MPETDATAQSPRGKLGESLGTLAEAFRNPNLRRLQLANAGSTLGSWSYFVALYIFAYQQGGAGAVGLLTVIRMIPSALAAPFSSTFADRFDRRHVMIVADSIRAVLMVVAAVTVWADGPAAVVYVIAALLPMLGGAWGPAEQALIPSLARTPGELTAANVASSTVISVAEFAGPAFGGLVLVLTSVSVLFLINGVSYLWSAALVLRIRPQPNDPADTSSTEHDEEEAEAETGRLAVLTAGARAILGNRDLRLLSGLYTGQTLVAGALDVFLVVIALTLLNSGAGGLGYINAAVGVGGLAGGFLALALATRKRLATDFALGVILFGIPLALVAGTSSIPIVLVCMAITGIGNSLVDINALTIMQRTVPDAVLGRALGMLDAVLLGAIGVGALLAPALIHVAGLDTALIATGLLLPLLVLPAFRRLRALDLSALAPVHLELLRSVRIFEALPETTLELLASSLREVKEAAGTVVIREGDHGDLFYVIGEGEVEVAGKTLGPGESFGEIALLRDIPRTATVTAATPVVLYALERDVFLAAVTGHRPAHATAEAVVAARLGTFASERTRVRE